MGCGCGKKRTGDLTRQADVQSGRRRAPIPGDPRPFKRVSYHVVNDSTGEVVAQYPTMTEARTKIRQLGGKFYRIEVRR